MKAISSIILIFILFSTGCTAFSAGPKMMTTIGEGAVSMGATLASKMNPKDMTANTGGTISDPRFTFKGHVATGVVFEFTAQLIGADLDYNIAAGGQGAPMVDPATADRIAAIWGNSLLSEEERKNKILEILQELAIKTIEENTTPNSEN